MTYDQAMARLQEIVQQLENGQAISLDQYTKLAKEAKELIEYCRKQLTELDGEIKQILE
ncbi:MAG: exodeoxyribonuclease VII small subunit [Paludibacteraceae bacterium]|nr:exodeoxyribonuclease VII small subunit [Paludibacteraceae bacterium]